MPHLAFALLALGSAAASDANLGNLPDTTPIHLGVAFRLPDPQALQQLLSAQQDPASPSYHSWLDPVAFGERFGLPESDYDSALEWFKERGFEVTAYPNRLFFEAVGQAGAVREALGVQLHGAIERGRRFHTFDGELKVPASFGSRVLHISGLDTRTHLRHRIDTTYGGQTYQVLGPKDFRLQYDMQALLTAGPGAAGLTTAVLATQEGTTPGTAQACSNGNPGAPFIPPSTAAIQAYFGLSGATATYNPIVMANTNSDFDTCGSNQEYQLDVEMQSVGAPNASDIDLVLSPASEVFQTGAQYVVNQVSHAVVVSTSLGLCESEEAQYYGGGPSTAGSEMQVLQQAVQQGLAEGQTWFAAAGDSGADDCADTASGTNNGYDGGNATVDFPGSLPEVVDLGGTQFAAAGTWDAQGNLLAFVPEVAWNEGEQGGAGGGGQSTYFAKPAYQQGVGPEAGDGVRDVPDLALAAASYTPGVAVYDCGTGQDQTCQGETTGPGNLDIFGGTSIASPLAAGMFALVAGQVGCRLGDIHSVLYALGNRQLDGGAQVFHDITSGNNNFVDPQNLAINGFAAGPGFDLATGWGSVDVATLVANWPSCAGTSSSTSSSGSTGNSTGSSTGLSSGSSTSGSGSSGSAPGSSASSSSASSSGASSSGASSGGPSSGATHTVSTSGLSGSASGTVSGSSGSSSGSLGTGASSGSVPSSTASTSGTTAASTHGTSATSHVASAGSTSGGSSAGTAKGGCSCGTGSGDPVWFGLPLAWWCFGVRRRRSPSA